MSEIKDIKPDWYGKRFIDLVAVGVNGNEAMSCERFQFFIDRYNRRIRKAKITSIIAGCIAATAFGLALSGLFF